MPGRIFQDQNSDSKETCCILKKDSDHRLFANRDGKTAPNFFIYLIVEELI